MKYSPIPIEIVGGFIVAYIEPNTTINFLIGIPFDPSYENTMYFDSIRAQETWMLSHLLYSFENYSYQRSGRGKIKVGWVTDVLGYSVIRDLYNSSYLMFKNTNFENKWFYAFVDSVEYINNNTVEVSYTIDIVQTWLFDFRFNQCLIEREHVTNDALGANTIPEQIEHGPYREDVPTYYMDGQVWSIGHYRYTPGVCLVTTFDAQGQYAPGGIIGGRNYWGDTYSGLHYTFWELTQQNVALINQTLEAIVSNAKQDGVVSIFMCPMEFTVSAITGGNISAKSLQIGINDSIDGYTPRNKKLFVYPYNMLYVFNNQGNAAEFRWEEFLNPSVAGLSIWGNVSTNPGLYCAPVAYKGVGGDNEEESISISGFPMCSWSNDAYKAWVAQNAGAIISSVIGVGAEWTTAIANPLNSGTGAFRSTIGLLGEVFDHKRMPPQAHGNGNGNLIFQNDLLSFSFRRKFIKAEYARIIDSYFDMYGYATHRVGLPNLNARPCYSYVKTVGASIDGAVPASVLRELEGLFNKGIRFWKPTATFGSFDPADNDNRV